MLGTKIYKSDMSKYTDCAVWCNQNNATIEDKGEYYEVVAIPEPTLDEVKATKIASLKADRDTREEEVIPYGGNTFDFDEKARERINAAIIALGFMGANTTIVWTTAENKDVTVNADDLRGIIAAVALRSNKLHVAYREAKEAVEAAETKETVEAISLDEYME